MKTTLLAKSMMIFAFVVLIISLIAIMIIFMGGYETISQSFDLILFLEYLLFAATCITGFTLTLLVAKFRANTLKSIWSRTPSWIIYAFCLLMLLVLTAMWAFHIASLEGKEVITQQQLIPLGLVFLSSTLIVLSNSLLPVKSSGTYAERSYQRQT